MAEKKLRFAIFGNTYQAKKSASIREILACLYRRGAEIYMERKFYEFLSKFFTIHKFLLSENKKSLNQFSQDPLRIIL